jgi:ribonuclease D
MPAAVTEALLTAVRRGLAVPPAEYPRPVEAAGAKQKIKSRTDRLLAQICDACKTHHIDPALVGARAEIESFLQLLDQGAAAEHPFTTGWRRTFITEELHQTVIRFQ